MEANGMSTSVCACRELTRAELMARVRNVTKSTPPNGANASAVNGHSEPATASDAFRFQAEFNRHVVESLSAMAAMCAQMEATVQSVQERLQAAATTSAATETAMAEAMA